KVDCQRSVYTRCRGEGKKKADSAGAVDRQTRPWAAAISVYSPAEKTMAEINLLSPGRIDGFETRNRLFMAPMTRCRANAGAVPSDLAVEYYSQRATAGLILTEGT